MLLTTKDELLKYDPVLSTFDFDKLKPFIEAAELTYIIPFISEGQYQELNTAYINSIKESNPTTLPEKHQLLLHQVRRPLVQLALFLGSASLAVQVSGNGIHRIEDSSKKTAYGYQEKNWQQAKMKLGFAFLDDLGSFLDKKLEQYTEYKNSEAYKTNRSLFVSSAKIITDQVGVNIGRFIFLLLGPHLKRAEKKVKRIIGKEEFTTLKEQLLNTISEDNLDKIDLIREAVAHIALSNATPLLKLKIDPQGVTIISNEKTKSVEVNQPIKSSHSKDLLDNLTATGEAALLELQDLYASLTEPEDENTGSIEQIPGAFMT
jgi:hypothetical protein